MGNSIYMVYEIVLFKSIDLSLISFLVLSKGIEEEV